MRWVEVARLAGLRFRSGDGEVACWCPWHEDHRPSASLNTATGLLCCYRCDRGARVDRLETAPAWARRLRVDADELRCEIGRASCRERV